MELPLDGELVAKVVARRGWSDAALDEWRHRSDPLGDEAITKLLRDKNMAPSMAAIRLLHEEMRDDFQCLPGFVVQLPPTLDRAKIAIAQEIFDVFGAQILMVLGLYSLPGAFAASRGVQVLAATGEIAGPPRGSQAPPRDVLRRVWETKKFVTTMLTGGGLLDQNAAAVKAARAVRLFHALTRARLVDPAGDLRQAWSRAQHRYGPAIGVPLNQEDKAGNLMEFAVVVIDGLSALGIELTRAQQESYLHAWQVVGSLLGVDAALIPDTLEEAAVLTAIIRRRQVGRPEPSPEGQMLTSRLIAAYNAQSPWFAPRVADAFLRHFLTRDPFRTTTEPPQDVAKMLGFPRRFTPLAAWSQIFVLSVRVFSDKLDALFDWTGPSDPLVRWIGRRLVGVIDARDPTGAEKSFMIADRTPDAARRLLSPERWKLDGERTNKARRWRKQARAERRARKRAKATERVA